jgi:hypothetical protein
MTLQYSIGNKLLVKQTFYEFLTRDRYIFSTIHYTTYKGKAQAETPPKRRRDERSIFNQYNSVIWTNLGKPLKVIPNEELDGRAVSALGVRSR